MKKTKLLHKPFEIEIKTLSQQESCQTRFYYSFLFILEGKGIVQVGKKVYDYKEDELVLLSPNESYSFNPEVESVFCFIRFNQIFLADNFNNDPSIGKTGWLEKIEYVFSNYKDIAPEISIFDEDHDLIKHLVKSLISENDHIELYNDRVISGILYALINVVARNIAMNQYQFINYSHTTSNALIIDILNHIQSNIHAPNKLSTSFLAERFKISANYIGEFFRKHTQTSLSRYIILYRLKLIESKLLFSDKSIKEIAYEFGFSNESHLTNTFKKEKGISPSSFRHQTSVHPTKNQ